MLSIINYHSIKNNIEDKFLQVTPENLKKHLVWLIKEGFVFKDIVEVIKNNEIMELAITFDDGFKNVTCGLEILKQLEIPATLFICPGLVGKNNDWNTNRLFKTHHLNTVQIKKLNQFGWRIECHMWDHKSLLEMSLKELEENLTKCNNWFVNNLSKNIEIISYPYGDYKDEQIGIIKSYCKYAVSVEQGREIFHPFAINRLTMVNHITKNWLINTLKRG